MDRWYNGCCNGRRGTPRHGDDRPVSSGGLPAAIRTGADADHKRSGTRPADTSWREDGESHQQEGFLRRAEFMFRAKLTALAAGAAAALALPLTAFAADSFTFSVNPTTHGAWSTTTSVLTVAKILKSQETALPAGESICHHGATCSPADNTKIGTTSVLGTWLFQFCSGSSTQNFDAEWVANDGSYTPPSGWSIVAQVNNVNSLATVKSWVIENSSGSYKIEIPSIPTLTCSGHTTKLTSTLGTYNGTSYDINQNPSTTGTYTVSTNLTFTDNSTESLNATYTVS
jgi:hypothetical protein